MIVESADYLGDAQLYQVIVKGKQLGMERAARSAANHVAQEVGREMGCTPSHDAIVQQEEDADGYLFVVAVWGDL